MKFNEMNLSKPLLRAIEEMGFEEATPIQSQTIPMALEGQDIFGQAQTGTGKTAAFGLPLLWDCKTKPIPSMIILGNCKPENSRA